MQTHEIILQKRTPKAILNFLMLAFLTMMLFTSATVAFTGNWQGIIFFLFVVLAIYYFGKNAVQYFYKEVRLVVESDGETIIFRNVNEAGKIFNETSIKELPKLTRFYVVCKRTRYMMNNYSYSFDGASWISGESVASFPSLYEATEADRNSVLAFVKSVHPNIELGYESAWKKLTKK